MHGHWTHLFNNSKLENDSLMTMMNDIVHFLFLWLCCDDLHSDVHMPTNSNALQLDLKVVFA